MPRLATLMSIAVVACGGSGGESEYEELLLRVQGSVADAGFGVADGLAQAAACETDEECLDGLEFLAAEYEPYLEVLNDQIEALEAADPPSEFVGLHRAYLEQMRLRVEAGELIIDGWATADDQKLQAGFRKFQESQAKLTDILDELEAFK